MPIARNNLSEKDDGFGVASDDFSVGISCLGAALKVNPPPEGTEGEPPTTTLSGETSRTPTSSVAVSIVREVSDDLVTYLILRTLASFTPS